MAARCLGIKDSTRLVAVKPMDPLRCRINPVELYHLRTIDRKMITEDILQGQPIHVENLFWMPHPHLQNLLHKMLDGSNISDRIVDIGAGLTPFDRATHLLDWNHETVAGKEVFKADLDYDVLPYEDNYFNFAYSRHTLEDLQNPLHAFKEITRIAKQGYIETPSPLIELLRGVDRPPYNEMRGFCHHRYIVWTDQTTHTLHFLPKYPFIEYIDISHTTLSWMTYLANNYPVYWNNYYVWDHGNPPKIVVYRNDINMSILNHDYFKLINSAVDASLNNTTAWIQQLLFAHRF